ncbi:ATP-binding cassette domain-containing protein [Glaciihabitans sp. UYNi722]|uniref:ATP-binding cassette domain-containing protein n=1 Tax=Glaciihabitans sp. UYNi722 TaxID=3156344 RepID=UPI00339452B0
MQIDISDARVSFGSRVVFTGMTATFESGVITALVGPSGSGKSTLLAAMAGYQQLDRGDISYRNGERSLSPDSGLIAWVPQGSNALGTRTALDNVMIAPLSEGRAPDDAREVATRALVDVGLGDRADQRVRQLSGGELQRVSFARALASSKPIIFADEPSAGLDGANTELLGALLAGLSSHATIVVATHDPILIDAAEAVVRLRSEHIHAP